ncbi:hypothetical protein GCM10027262_12060 [Nocardia tengchongensis]
MPRITTEGKPHSGATAAGVLAAAVLLGAEGSDPGSDRWGSPAATLAGPLAGPLVRAGERAGRCDRGYPDAASRLRAVCSIR